ncbi:MAG: glycosyltransferase family 2 protein [Pseudomonadota bacterium]
MTIAVVIPSYKVTDFILDVISSIGPDVNKVYVVDDCCPNNSGAFVEEHCNDKRVVALRHTVNQGVGGAVMTGMQQAMKDGCDIVVKVDGDGQMDPKLITDLVQPLVDGDADYTKGNRFHSFYSVKTMPAIRLFGNAMLSFMTKFSSGYWSIFDPTNGFVAIHKTALSQLDMSKLSKRYFFETDMLIQLGDMRAVVADYPMSAVYGEETSNLHVRQVLFEFLGKHLRAIARRIVYTYFLRDFSIASVNLFFGTLLLLIGVLFGGFSWVKASQAGTYASIGTVMLSVLPIILGFQMVLQFLSYDMSNEPRRSLQSRGH